jgi:Na+/melibiose symporter-like transporter
MFVFEGITIVGFFVFYFIGITGFLSAFLFAVCTGFATTVFYGVMYSLIYDCCDIHELATGERTEGSIMAISSLAQTVASAVGGLIFGMLLTFIGYDTANITPEVIHGILTLVTIVPAIAMIASLLILCLYKVNPKRFQDVQEALNNRREDKEIDLNEFKDII